MKKRIRKAMSNLFRINDIIGKNNQVNNLTKFALYSSSRGINEKQYLEKPIIVSLTTYGRKIYEVHLVIESIFAQTCKANRVILYLCNKKFSADTIPVLLKNQEKRGLEIRYITDIGSYKKLIPAYKEFGNSSNIISVDDDMLYPMDMIEQFISEYKNNPNKIYFNKGHRIIFDNKGEITPYIRWVKENKIDKQSLLNLPIGAYGIFYSSNSLNQEVLNEEVFLSICPMADDIWFKAMSILSNVECVHVEQGTMNGNNYYSIELNREISLARTNVDKGYNDVQIKAVLNKYNLREILFKNENIKSNNW